MGELDGAQHGRDDWFLPAMEARGALDHCLDQVVRLQEAKLSLVQGLKKNICAGSRQVPDRITELRRQIYDFAKTLEMRLGILSFDRPAAWFRQSYAHELGPFPGKISQEAIFLPFDPMKAKLLKVELKTAWTQRSETVRSFEREDASGSTCLWLILLEFNHRWDKICELPEPFEDLRLDELPEALPDELASKALEAFLQRVRGAIAACREDLDRCFDTLWQASDPFLAKQFMLACQKQQAGSYRRSTYRSHGDFYHHSWSPPGKARNSSAQLEEALKFMEFSTLPSREDLRKRYRNLARQYHPDFEGGSEEKFKSLNQYYRTLLDAS